MTRKIIVKRKDEGGRKVPGIELPGECQQYLIATYWCDPANTILRSLYKNEDDFLSKTLFRVTSDGRFDKRTTKALSREFTFPGKEHLQQYEWGKKVIKRRR